MKPKDIKWVMSEIDKLMVNMFLIGFGCGIVAVVIFVAVITQK